MAKVSVILPVYNVEQYLEQCLDSIIGQTLRDIEIICIDDGSSDNSLNILKSYQKKDSRIRLIEQKNSGAGAARNAGMQVASGQCLSFLDSDDFFEPDMLEKAYECLEQYQADFVVFDSDQFHMDKQEFVDVPWVFRKQEIPPYMPFSHRELTDNVFKVFVGWAWDKLYRRSFVEAHSLRFQEQRTSNDLLFVFSALVLAKRIAVVSQVLAHQRRGSSTSLSVTREKSWHCFYDALTALRRRLVEENIYWELEQDFINYALHFCLWNLNSLAEPTHHLLQEKLCSEWFSELGIVEKPESYFYSLSEYEQYKMLMRSGRRGDIMDKVSVILPIYNVSAYLRECLDSVIAQTLKELEIICVNDGSTDDSLDIIQEYAAKDPRIIVVTGPNGGYGKAMNKGLDRATGEYVGIVEPDDYIAPDMYESLYRVAFENDLDFVKSDFYRFSRDEQGQEHLEYVTIDRAAKRRYGQLLNPSVEPDCIRFTMNTWTGIYRRDFLEAFHIRHHETPGASFQDNGFFFQTFIYAKRAMIVNQAYYRNRRDNPNSSVKSKEKVYCMNIEYDFIRDILMQDQVIWERFKYMYWWKKYFCYMFTLDRIGDSFREEYRKRMSREFHRAMQKGELSRDTFTELEWQKIRVLTNNANDEAILPVPDSMVRVFAPFIPRFIKRRILEALSENEAFFSRSRVITRKKAEAKIQAIRSSAPFRLGFCLTFPFRYCVHLFAQIRHFGLLKGIQRTRGAKILFYRDSNPVTELALLQDSAALKLGVLLLLPFGHSFRK